MHILELRAQNVKRLEVVKITPKGPVIVIAGANESGKSSVLDAIWYAMGGARQIPSVPIRQGATKAVIQLDIGGVDGGFTIERTFTARGTTLKVESGDRRLKQPQQVLDALFGALTFDPLAFTGLDPRGQYNLLTSTVAMPVNPDEVAQMNEKTASDRTEVRRDIVRLKGEVQSIELSLPGDLPDEIPDTDSLMNALASAAGQNERRAKYENERSRLVGVKEVHDRAARDASRVVDECTATLKDARDRFAASDTAAETAVAELDGFDETAAPDRVDTDALRRDLDQARTLEEFARQRQRRDHAKVEIGVKEAEADALAGRIDERRRQVRDALAAVVLPVDGLGIGDGEVLYKGLPLDQASSAVQLEISVAIAMALNPKLKVLRIEHGSRLDAKHMKRLTDMAIAKGYQVWIERVDESGKVGIVMSEGKVVADNQPETGAVSADQGPGEPGRPPVDPTTPGDTEVTARTAMDAYIVQDPASAPAEDEAKSDDQGPEPGDLLL